MSGLSLYVIEESLEELMRLGAEAEDEGDAEAAEVIYQQLAEYLTRETVKVNSYAALIRRCESEAEVCNAEAKRLTDRARRAAKDVERLKGIALRVMQMFDVKEMKTPTNTLRRQKNGGLEPLDIPTPYYLPEDLQLKSVTTNIKTWHEICHFLGQYQGGLDLRRTIVDILEGQQSQASTHFIREALKMQVPCPECASTKAVYGGVPDCPRCDGKGTIPNTIPGAKLLPRGEHVRLS